MPCSAALALGGSPSAMFSTTLSAASAASAGGGSSAGRASNVDLAKEFTNMIVTQRGFQANSRVITTTDQMLEELVNLKR